MNKEHLIKLARDLAESFVYNKNMVYQVEHHYMLCMSNFIFSKERIIKTDSKNRTLHFDDTKENTMKINQFYEKIKDDFIFTMNGSTPQNELFNRVILEHDKEDLELKKKIFIIGKIRDSLAHGKYEFDTKNNKIIIKNSYKVGNDDFYFGCSVEPETLDILTKQYQHENRKRILSLIYNKDYDSYLNKIENKYIEKNSSNNKDDDKLLEAEDHVSDNVEEYIKKVHNQLEILKAEIQYAKEISNKNKILLLKNYTHILKKIEELEKDKDGLNVQELKQTIDKSIYSMAMNISEELDRNVVNTAVVYNYLTLLLSEREELDFRYLKSPSSKVYFKKINEKNGENDITGTLGRLKRSIKIFNRKYQEAQKSPEDIKKNTMRQLIINLYNETMEAFENRNRCIYNRIRNGIMHCTIESKGKKIVIKDSSDHNMDKPSFIIEATTKELLDYAKCIEDKNSQEEFTLKDFISELYMAVNNYGINDDQIKRFFDNLSKCLLCVDKSTKLNDKTDDIKDKLTNMNTQGYLENITKLRDILLQRKEELESKSPSM